MLLHLFRMERGCDLNLWPVYLRGYFLLGMEMVAKIPLTGGSNTSFTFINTLKYVNYSEISCFGCIDQFNSVFFIFNFTAMRSCFLSEHSYEPCGRISKCFLSGLVG